MNQKYDLPNIFFARCVNSIFVCVRRMVHGFTCAGLLPSQYTNFTQFCRLGNVGHSYIRQAVTFDKVCSANTCTDSTFHIQCIFRSVPKAGVH